MDGPGGWDVTWLSDKRWVFVIDSTSFKQKGLGHLDSKQCKQWSKATKIVAHLCGIMYLERSFL